VGIVGAFIAGWLFPRIGFSIGGGTLAAIIHATIGAIILLVLVKVLKRA
ncbi:GlsB/YeaQ/YmgE family stress response membrane protein, partial [Mesorhizobium sp.]